MTLWLVRHAQPLVAPGTCYGALDVPADTQATRTTARVLAQALPQGAELLSSPLQRCTQLALALHTLRPDLVYRTEPDLAEMHFGVYEGVLWKDIPQAALDGWTDDFWRHRFGGRESVADFMARVSAVWDAAQARRQAGAVQVWVTHAGVARAVSLLEQGLRTLQRADQWPVQAPAFGQWVCWP